jgi:hypothetical protein
MFCKPCSGDLCEIHNFLFMQGLPLLLKRIRKKSILATYHGRYHTIGMADLRAVSVDMLPVFSCGCRSTDTEAMNVVEVIKEVQEICNGSVKIYSGNGHTTSRVAAGMVFLSFDVVAAGRIIHKPTKPLGKKRIAKLRKNINLLNRIGKLGCGTKLASTLHCVRL